MSTSNFGSDLRDYYEAKRRSHLTGELQQTSTYMRETMLLRVVHEALFDETIQLEDDVQNGVDKLRKHVQNSEFDAIENELPTIRRALKSERDGVRSKLQHKLHDIEDRISGFESLNDRIEKIPNDRLDSLRETAANLDEVPTDQDETFGEVEEDVRERANEFKEELVAVETALFEDFQGSDIEETVRTLLSGERLRLDACKEEELLALQQSDIGPYVNLSIEGE